MNSALGKSILSAIHKIYTTILKYLSWASIFIARSGEVDITKLRNEDKTQVNCGKNNILIVTFVLWADGFSAVAFNKNAPNDLKDERSINANNLEKVVL